VSVGRVIKKWWWVKLSRVSGQKWLGSWVEIVSGLGSKIVGVWVKIGGSGRGGSKLVGRVKNGLGSRVKNGGSKLVGRVKNGLGSRVKNRGSLSEKSRFLPLGGFHEAQLNFFGRKLYLSRRSRMGLV